MASENHYLNKLLRPWWLKCQFYMQNIPNPSSGPEILTFASEYCIFIQFLSSWNPVIHLLWFSTLPCSLVAPQHAMYRGEAIYKMEPRCIETLIPHYWEQSIPRVRLGHHRLRPVEITVPQKWSVKLVSVGQDIKIPCNWRSNLETLITIALRTSLVVNEKTAS